MNYAYNKMKRRRFIESVVGLSLGYGSMGSISEIEITDTPEINISIFYSSKFRIKESVFQKSAQVIRKSIEYAFQTIPNKNQKITVNTNVYNNIDDSLIFDEYHKGRSKIFWDYTVIDTLSKILDNQVSVDKISRDSNVLLTPYDFDSGVKGRGEYPRNCKMNNNNMSIVNATTYNFRDLPSDIYYKRRDSYNPFLNTIVHEIGHNIGLKHSHGDAYRSPSSDKYITTPMISEYIRSERGPDRNRYGREIPQIDDHQSIVTEPQYNPDITLKDLTVGCDEYS